MKVQGPIIKTVTPSLGVPGGEVTIVCRGFQPGLPSTSRVMVGDSEANIVSASEDLVIVRLPDNPKALGISLRVDGAHSPVFPFGLAAELASGLHPVANPVIAPGGGVITTISGSRHQQVSQPLVLVSRQGEKKPYPCEIMNPTGLAFGPDGHLYISSRSEGVVYRYRNFQQLEVVAENLGIPCGIVFDPEGFLFVGDRTGKIHKIGTSGHPEEFASLEPSVSAYHLAVDQERTIYVTGPTISMRDSLYSISRSGRVDVLMSGFARPQGLAVDASGDLWIAAAHGGKKGIFRFRRQTRHLTHYIAAPMLVGLAFSEEVVFLTDNSSVYWMQMSG